MRYVSTRGQIEPIEFQDAVLMGLADDGGLIIPESIPDATGRLGEWKSLDYSDLAFEILRLFVGDIPEADLKTLIEKTYSRMFNPAPVVTVRVGPVYVLELWHGPTLAFKDIALQLLGNLFEYILARRGGRLNILGATSGDTGSAAIAGCRGRAGIDIFIMHPAGRVSEIQQRQMTTVLDENVHNIAVAGNFDDCQMIMKTLAADLDFKGKYSLGAVNSVNWARVLAQIVYYFAAVFHVQSETGAKQVRVEVPTGNFGDILAGWYARQMGLPISQLILATNENDILARFFSSGEYSTGRLTQTLSPSMDIQIASNFERYLYYKLGCDAGRLRALMGDFARTGSLRVEVGTWHGRPAREIMAETAMLRSTGVSPVNRNTGVPPVNRNTGVPPVNRNTGVPPVNRNTGVPPVNRNTGVPPVNRNTGVPPVNRNTGVPPVNRNTGVPPVSEEDMAETSMLPSSVDPAFIAGVGTQDDVLATIRKYHRQYNYLLDPHTAVGVAVAEAMGISGDPLVCLSTAHPAKFPEAIKKATGQDLAHHPAIDALADLPTRCVELPNDIEAVREFIVETIG